MHHCLGTLTSTKLDLRNLHIKNRKKILVHIWLVPFSPLASGRTVYWFFCDLPFYFPSDLSVSVASGLSFRFLISLRKSHILSVSITIQMFTYPQVQILPDMCLHIQTSLDISLWTLFVRKFSINTLNRLIK